MIHVSVNQTPIQTMTSNIFNSIKRRLINKPRVEPMTTQEDPKPDLFDDGTIIRYRERWLRTARDTIATKNPAGLGGVLAELYRQADISQPKFHFHCSSPTQAATLINLIRMGVEQRRSPWTKFAWIFDGTVANQIQQAFYGIQNQIEDAIGATTTRELREQVATTIYNPIKKDLVEVNIQKHVHKQLTRMKFDQGTTKQLARCLDSAVGRSTGSPLHWTNELEKLIFPMRGAVSPIFNRVLVDGLMAFEDMLPSLAYYDAISERWKGSEFAKLEPLFRLVNDSCAGAFLYDGAVLTYDRPLFRRTDDQDRLHYPEGPAIEYRDGTGVYFWHGLEVDSEWITNPESLDPLEILGRERMNAELRRAACEIIGWDRVIAAGDAKTIDKDADPEIGELLEVQLPNTGSSYFLKVVCGTGRNFVIPVPNNMKTALEANAWTYGYDKDKFLPEIRT